jgi:hypothetical protein
LEWRLIDTQYPAPISHLSGNRGGGANGIHLFDSSTVADDAASDILDGDAGHDWFSISVNAEVHATTGETVTPT